MKNALRSRQEGVTLVIGMIFLVILTLMALSSFNFGKSNFLVTANMQQRIESTRAVEQVLDELVNNTNISLTTGAIFGSSNARSIDINGDGKAEVTVTVATPTCRKSQVIKQSALDLSKTDDLACSSGYSSSSAGIENASNGDSICSDVVWELSASGTQSWDTAKVTLVAGLAQRVSTNLISSYCY